MSPLFSSTLPKFPREMGGPVADPDRRDSSDAPRLADLAFFRSDFFSRVDFLSLRTIPAPVHPSSAHHNILWSSKMSDNIYYVNFLGFSERFLSDFGELLSPQVPTTISCVSTTEASDPPSLLFRSAHVFTEQIRGPGGPMGEDVQQGEGRRETGGWFGLKPVG